MSLEYLQRRRLSSPVGAEEGVELAMLDVEGEILHGMQVAVGDVQPIDLDDRAGRGLCVEHASDRHCGRAVARTRGSPAANAWSVLPPRCARSVVADLVLDCNALHWPPSSCGRPRPM